LAQLWPGEWYLLATVFHVKHVWTILHGGALGDLALTLHLARGLPGVEPESCLDLIARIPLDTLADAKPAIRFHSSETTGVAWLYGGDAAPPPALRALVRGRWVFSALDGPGSRVDRRLHGLEPRGVYSIDPRPRRGCTTHIVTQWRRMLAASGPACGQTAHETDGPAVCVSQQCIARGRARLASVLHRADPGAGAKFVLVHPGSGGVAKCWPLAGFVAVAEKLAAHGGDVVWLLGPAELERWPVTTIADLRRRFAVLAPPTSGALLDVLAAGGLLIANDCGPAHLAALIGTPTVVLFGPTSPDIWRPLGPRVRILRGDPRRGASWGITPEAVARAAGDTSIM